MNRDKLMFQLILWLLCPQAVCERFSRIFGERAIKQWLIGTVWKHLHSIAPNGCFCTIHDSHRQTTLCDIGHSVGRLHIPSCYACSWSKQCSRNRWSTVVSVTKTTMATTQTWRLPSTDVSNLVNRVTSCLRLPRCYRWLYPGTRGRRLPSSDSSRWPYWSPLRLSAMSRSCRLWHAVVARPGIPLPPRRTAFYRELVSV